MTELKFHPASFSFEWPAAKIFAPVKLHRLNGLNPEILKSTLKVICDDPVRVEVVSVEFSKP